MYFEIKKLLYGGDVLILPPNMLHAVYPCEDNLLVYYALVFNPIMLGANSNDRCTTECIRPIINGNVRMNVLISTDSDSYSEINETVIRIFSCAHDNLPQADLLLKSELMKLFWLLENDEDIICQKDTGINYSEIIRPALEFMVKNFQQEISIEQLAELVHLSKSYFMNCFKKAVGIGAIEHLTQLRINAACEVLLSTDQKISDIALNCGYANLSNFNRHFLKMVGCSPNQYRKKNRTVIL